MDVLAGAFEGEKSHDDGRCGRGSVREGVPPREGGVTVFSRGLFGRMKPRTARDRAVRARDGRIDGRCLVLARRRAGA